MKRLSFLFLVVACVVFSSCREDDDNQAYSITTLAGYGGAVATADKGVALEGETVTVTATPAEGFLFKQWKVRVGNTVIDNVEANPATFTMPVENVVIIATFMIRNDVLERITDPALKAYCQSRMDAEQNIDGVIYPKWDTNGNGILSPDEAAAVKAIDVTGGINGTKIKNVDELVEFKGLEILKVGENDISTLEVVWSKLVKLDCSHNKLTKLLTGRSGKLKELYCNNNHLPSANFKTMAYDNGYMLHCGNQTTEEGEPQTFAATLTEEQIAFWDSNLKELSENANVETQTRPCADVFLTITSARKTTDWSNIGLTLEDGKGASISVYLYEEELDPGEYTAEDISWGYVTVPGGGSYRDLDYEDSGSITVKYDEETKIYTIEGTLILQQDSSYPSVNAVGFKYVGTL